MFQRLWSSIEDLTVIAFVSLLFGIAKVAILPDKIGVKAGITYVFLSVIVGTLAGALALEAGWGDYAALTCSSITSLLSRDIVAGLVTNRQFLGTLVKRALENLTDKFTK